MLQQRKTRAKPRSRTSPPPPPPAFEISTENRFAPLREPKRHTVILGDSIVRHVHATGDKVLGDLRSCGGEHDCEFSRRTNAATSIYQEEEENGSLSEILTRTARTSWRRSYQKLAGVGSPLCQWEMSFPSLCLCSNTGSMQWDRISGDDGGTGRTAAMEKLALEPHPEHQ
ncbi:uncharacterized protein LOC124384636 isoform X2 [Silurus meridionalis]|uniref:uncharacterized protein LOC124384636 isoform X2 n=1 Tax=Silurus meridionalis TaxID=175797 RepID=UPI001EE9CE95|nr:uncharacterized protein LOC124384636 isoform X2 [Silurus meridionalis]